jgi:hypothetical protein
LPAREFFFILSVAASPRVQADKDH